MLLDGAIDTAGEDVGAEVGFLRQRAPEPDAVDGFQGVHHGADGFESACDEGLGFGERGGDGLGELEEKGFPLARAFALVEEPELLVRAAAELDKVKAAGF